jgi:hypothetical protein
MFIPSPMGYCRYHQTSEAMGISWNFSKGFIKKLGVTEKIPEMGI